MISIAYFSSAAGPSDPAALSAILDQARRNNAANGVTGMLCHYDGSFLQFLEGAPAAVAETFERICRDSRHHQVLKVLEQPISARAFADWTMAVVKPGDVSPEHQAFCKGLRSVSLTATSDPGGRMSALLQAFTSWMR